MNRGAAVALSTLCMLSGCVPWTVRPIAEERRAQPQGKFQAGSYVDSIWTSKVLPRVEGSALDLKSVLAAPNSPPGGLVKGTARVLRVSLTPPSGTLELDLLPGDGKPDALLQVGPVMRGSALRDAVGFIQFSEFTNQIDYADVSSELNLRAARALPPATQLSTAAGKTIEFAGAYSMGEGGIPSIVPVRFRWLEGGR